MTVIMNLNTAKARLEPETVFSGPLDIVAEKGLTRGQKIATLDRWNETLQHPITATREGMMPPAGQTAEKAATIEEISKARELLYA